MRRLIWPALTLLLTGLAFGAGRISAGFRVLPAIVATLPGEERDFSRELDFAFASVSRSGRAKTRWSIPSRAKGSRPNGGAAIKPMRPRSSGTGCCAARLLALSGRRRGRRDYDLHAEYESHCF